MRAKERGATAVVVAVLLAVLCGFVALSVDVGHTLSVRGELQNGADAAALAGARRLTGRNRSMELAGAESDARTYARNHPTDRWDVEAAQIQLGAWVREADACPANTASVPVQKYGYKLCEISARTEAAAADINAVRVVTRRDGRPGGTGGGGVELAFGGVVGHSQPATVVAEAIALSGGPSTQGKCDLPVAIRAGCLYDDGEIRCDGAGAGSIYYIGLSPAPTDSAGLTSLSGTTSASANAICGVLETGKDCSDLGTGTPINIQNGTSWSAACDPGCSYQAYTSGASSTPHDSICEVLRKRADRNCDGIVDDSDGDGVPDYRAQVPVVKFEDESLETCSGNYNQSARIVGWATIAIVSARCETVSRLPFDKAPITKICDDYERAHGSFSGDTCVAIRLYCNQEDDHATRVGGGWYGTAPRQPVLVR
jgi:hypothetical protein